MSKKLRLILAGILIIVGFFGEHIANFVKDNIEIVNTPSVDIDEPTLEYKTLVKEITEMDISKQDAGQISDFFYELSSVVDTDPGFVKTTGVFREFNIRSGGLNFSGLDLKGKYPSLGTKIDNAIMNTVGKEDTSLTDKKRRSLCDCLNAIAWSVQN